MKLRCILSLSKAHATFRLAELVQGLGEVTGLGCEVSACGAGTVSVSSPSLGGAQSSEDVGCQHVLAEGSKEEPCRQLGVT